ncbi:MAG: 4-hydroxy-tetrahydrodipicolinate reductase [Pseudomonadota bacterium]|nr:4-hydroxy-tetrahydrodipicolinate reductase [Pseudomonadota bacterium]
MHTLAIFGISGRMGQSLLRALRETPDLRLSGAIASAGSSRLGQDAAAEGESNGVRVTADPVAGLRGASVAVDFSAASAAADHVHACVTAGVPVLVGTTGLDAAGRGLLAQAATHIPVLIAPNTSVGVGVLTKLVSMAAAGLGPAFDIEISEAHHRLKRDAPSGTALALGEAAAATRGQTLQEVAIYERTALSQPRTPGSIGFSVVRAGDIVGEHTVTFAAAGERVEITHRATDRIIFARGALRAARWLIGRPAGLYAMQDVIGL